LARANRHFVPGYIWHITHRCHNREFLLKFSRDKRRWLYWLSEAKKRFKLIVLDYVVTSNHIHLLVYSRNRSDIPESIQLIAGRSGQEYNIRKKRKGAFWQDRYHATAVESQNYLLQCIVYIDLNMVRTGVVQHPSEWEFAGFNEIQNPPMRYRIIDRQYLLKFLGFESEKQMQEAHRKWVDTAIQTRRLPRNSVWTESVAFGSQSFVEKIKNEMGYKAIGRKIEKSQESLALRETILPYKSINDPEISELRPDNYFYWDSCAINTSG